MWLRGVEFVLSGGRVEGVFGGRRVDLGVCEDFAVDFERLLMRGGVVSRADGGVVVQYVRRSSSVVFPVRQRLFVGRECIQERLSFCDVWMLRSWLVWGVSGEVYFPVGLWVRVVEGGVEFELVGAGGLRVGVYGEEVLSGLWSGIADVLIDCRGVVVRGGVQFGKARRGDVDFVLTLEDRGRRKVVPLMWGEGALVRLVVEKALIGVMGSGAGDDVERLLMFLNRRM